MTSQSLRTYVSMWLGQSISALGSTVFGFALSFYIYSETGRADYIGYFVFAQTAPSIYFSLFLGPFVDRFNKKTLLIVSDVAQLLFTLAMLPFLFKENVADSILPLLALSFVSSIFSALQGLTFISGVRLFATTDRLNFINGLTQVFRSIPLVIGPLASLPLLNLIGLKGLVVLDFLTFAAAFANMLLIRFPELDASVRPALSLSRLRSGWDIIRSSSVLSSSLAFFAWNNLMAGLGSSFVLVLLIDAAEKSDWIVSVSSSMGALGGVLGGLLLAGLSNKLKRPFVTFAVTILLASVLGRIGFSLLTLPLVTGLFLFVRCAILPVMNGANDSIWQALVTPENQGCTFATRRLIAQGLYPIGLLLGPILVIQFESTAVFMVVVGLGELLSVSVLGWKGLRGYQVQDPNTGQQSAA